MNALDLLKIYATSTEFKGKEFSTAQGLKVEILELSNIDTKTGVIVADAQISIDSQRISGRVAFIERSSLWRENILYFSEKIVLLVSLDDHGVCCDMNGQVIPSIEVKCQNKESQKLQELIDGAESYGCGAYIASLKDIDRVSLCTNLLIERVEMKSNDITEILNENQFSWSETFYSSMMKMIGMGRNQKAFIRLSKIVPYRMICRERDAIKKVEALLLGAAGFLEDPIDSYEMSLAKEFKHLKYKHNIRVMRRSDWGEQDRSTTRPASHPMLRLAQIAALVQSKDFLFDNALNCRTPEDVHKLFSACASEYWDTHYVFGFQTKECVKNITKDAAEILGINVVCMMMFCHGQHTANQELKDAALDLLEKLKVEKNRITINWQKAGVKIENAAFGQAMLQLYKIYCYKKRCSSCFVGKARMKSE